MAHDARYVRRLYLVYVVALVMFAFRIWSPPVIAATTQWTEITARMVALVAG